MYWRGPACADCPSVSSLGNGDTAATADAARNSRLSTCTSSKGKGEYGATTRRQCSSRYLTTERRCGQATDIELRCAGEPGHREHVVLVERLPREQRFRQRVELPAVL